MNQSQRYFFQVFLWFGIWTVLWGLNNSGARFIVANGTAFIFQILLLAGLIFYAAPKLLFRKKYGYFIVASLAGVVLFTWIASQQPGFSPPSPPGGPPIEGPKGPPRAGASRFSVHFLMLSLSYILATFLETFVFAQKKEEETIKNKNEKLETELKLLKSQINPHFLFNSLNNIYALSVIDAAKTQQSINYLSQMLRYVLYECDQKLVPLEKEIAYIENYIRLFSLKSSKVYPITTMFSIADKGVEVAPMLFIPFMENALKHSNIEKIINTFIKIKIESDHTDVLFEIENSVPENMVVKDKIGGIGIDNVKRRLAILYPDKHELVINESTTVFKVALKIQLHGKD